MKKIDFPEHDLQFLGTVNYIGIDCNYDDLCVRDFLKKTITDSLIHENIKSQKWTISFSLILKAEEIVVTPKFTAGF